MRIKRAIAVAALTVSMSTTGFAVADASAPNECSVQDFTSDGVFDQEGYLACLSAGGTEPTGGLPATGGNSLQAVGLAAGLLLAGGSMVVSANRRKTSGA